MNIKNYNNFSIYFDKSDLYSKYMNETNIENIDMIANNSYKFEKYETKNNFVNFNNIGNEYLVIKLEYSYNNYYGILGLIPEIHDLVEDNIIGIEKGKKAVIRYSHSSGIYILVSSNKNIKKLDIFFSSKYTYEILISNDKNNLVYVDSSNEDSKIKLFKVEFNYHENTNFKLYTNNDINNELDKYGTDSLFKRRSSHADKFQFNSFYIYGLKEKYYLYIKKNYGNIDFYQYNKELNEFSDMSKFAQPYDYSDDFDLI